jgi:hypothetical protein
VYRRQAITKPIERISQNTSTQWPSHIALCYQPTTFKIPPKRHQRRWFWVSHRNINTDDAQVSRPASTALLPPPEAPPPLSCAWRSCLTSSLLATGGNACRGRGGRIAHLSPGWEGGSEGRNFTDDAQVSHCRISQSY